MPIFVVNKTIETSEPFVVVDGGLEHGVHRFMLEVETKDGRRSAPMVISIEAVADVRQPVSPIASDERIGGLVTGGVVQPAQPIDTTTRPTRPTRPVPPIRPNEPSVSPTRPVLRPTQPTETPSRPVVRPTPPTEKPAQPAIRPLRPFAPSPAAPGRSVRPADTPTTPSTPSRKPSGRKRPDDRDPQV